MSFIRVQGLEVPSFMYGTAWKEKDTARCVAAAISVGFRAIDTASQRKHYHEAGVGVGIARARERGLAREELFLQSKFTYRRGQDHRLPYDPRAPLATQVEQSFETSLTNLRSSHLDAYLLHSPMHPEGLRAEDWEVWTAMERLYEAGRVSFLGISNISAHHLDQLVVHAKVPPAFVQNRCYARTGWDHAVRRACLRHGVVYQGFSLLTANRNIFSYPGFNEIRERHERSEAQIVFRFAQQLGMLPLTGTSRPAHMREDLLGLDFELDDREMAQLEKLLS